MWQKKLKIVYKIKKPFKGFFYFKWFYYICSTKTNDEYNSIKTEVESFLNDNLTLLPSNVVSEWFKIAHNYPVNEVV